MKVKVYYNYIWQLIVLDSVIYWINKRRIRSEERSDGIGNAEGFKEVGRGQGREIHKVGTVTSLSSDLTQPRAQQSVGVRSRLPHCNVFTVYPTVFATH